MTARSSHCMTPDDEQAVEDFTAFLIDPSTRCPVCLNDTHTKPSQCPKVPAAERTVALDVAYENAIARVQERATLRRSA